MEIVADGTRVCAIPIGTLSYSARDVRCDCVNSLLLRKVISVYVEMINELKLCSGTQSMGNKSIQELQNVSIESKILQKCMRIRCERRVDFSQFDQVLFADIWCQFI